MKVSESAQNLMLRNLAAFSMSEELSTEAIVLNVQVGGPTFLQSQQWVISISSFDRLCPGMLGRAAKLHLDQKAILLDDEVVGPISIYLG